MFGLDVNSIKPWQTLLVGAVGLLALGKPVTGAKQFPDDFTLTLPGFKGKKSLAQVCPLCLHRIELCQGCEHATLRDCHVTSHPAELGHA